MRRALVLHPAFQCAPVSALDADIARPTPSTLLLRFTLSGALPALALPQPATPARTDELWKHTCFEAFLKPFGDDRYFEFNLAPSRQWAAYAFTDYRAGMRNADELGAPDIAITRSGDDRFELGAAFDLSKAGVEDGAWRVGLSAVIEERGGGVSYWAAEHAPGRPDFHHADSFSLVLSL